MPTAPTSQALYGTSFNRIFGRHTPDSLGLSSDPVNATANATALTALPASAGCTMTAGLWPLGAGSVSAQMKMEPGALVQPPAGVTVTWTGEMDAPPKQVFDTSLGGAVAFTRGSQNFINAKWFGAEHFGSSAAALTAAIAAASAAKTPLYIPPGSYTIAEPITVPTRSDLHIYGAGPNLTQLIATGAWDIFQFTGAFARLYLHDIWLGYDTTGGTTYASGTALSIVGTAGTRASHIYLHRVVVQNAPTPVDFQYIDLGRVADLRILQSTAGAVKNTAMRVFSCIGLQLEYVIGNATVGTMGDYGLVIDSDCDTIHATDCSFGQTTKAPIALRHTVTGGSHTPSRLTQLNGCSTEECTGDAGLLIEDARIAQIYGHESSGNKYGVHYVGGTGVVVRGSLIWQNVEHGALMAGGVLPALVDSDVFDNSTGTANTSSGVRMEVSGASVQGCNINNAVFGDGSVGQKYGIDVKAGIDYYRIVGNTFKDGTANHDNRTAAINDGASGANAVVVHNVGA